MRRRRRTLVAWLCLAPLMLVILFPFAVMVTTAIRPRAEILVFPPVWIPHHVRLWNFVDMWRAVEFGQALVNSAIVSAGATLLALLIALPAAYATARLRFRGGRMYQQFLLITQMLSPIVLILGIFRLMAVMGLVDQTAGLVLAYAAFNLAFAIWMLQAYFRTIPKELEEAAILDGATALQRFRLVFLPLATPALGVTTTFVFIYCWNEFVLALSILRSPDKYTLPLQIFSLVGGRYSIEWDHVMAATPLATVPAAIAFAALQRYLVRGLALGAIK